MSTSRPRSLSIFGRTFLLMVAALLVAEGVGMALLLNQSAPRNEPVSLRQIARVLETREPFQPPPDRVDGEFGGPRDPGPEAFDRDGPPPGPPGPRAPFANPQAWPDFTPFIDTRLADAAPAAPAYADAATSAALRQRLADLLHVEVDAIVIHVRRADLNGPDADDAALRKGFIAARRISDGQWRIAEGKAAGFASALPKQALLLFGIGLIFLLPLAWLFAAALAAPIRRFSQAAQGIGTAPYTAPLPVEGPAEMHAAIESFNAMQARLNRLLQERTQMIAAIAHDLRTPLTRLAFRLDDLPEPLNTKVDADIQEMRAMISAALDFIRDRSLSTRRERLDFRLLVESVIDDATDAGRDVTLEPGDPVTIEGDPLGLRRAITNLVDNAVKYGKCARLRLSTGNARCTLEVDDEGPGIAEPLQQRVFEPFFRLESSRNRDTGGFGLGLAFVRSTVIEHGGDVTLRNRPGGGLRVTLWLPVAI